MNAVLGIWRHTYPVVVDLLEVFVGGVVTRQHGGSWEHQVEQHQSQHVGYIVPVEKITWKIIWKTVNICQNSPKSLLFVGTCLTLEVITTISQTLKVKTTTTTWPFGHANIRFSIIPLCL